MKNFLIALIACILLASCSTLEYLPNDLNDVPKTMKAQKKIMEQVLENYYIMGVMDYRSTLENHSPLLSESADYYYLEALKKSDKDLYKKLKKYIGDEE